MFINMFFNNIDLTTLSGPPEPYWAVSSKRSAVQYIGRYLLFSTGQPPPLLLPCQLSMVYTLVPFLPPSHQVRLAIGSSVCDMINVKNLTAERVVPVPPNQSRPSGWDPSRLHLAERPDRRV